MILVNDKAWSPTLIWNAQKATIRLFELRQQIQLPLGSLAKAQYVN